VRELNRKAIFVRFEDIKLITKFTEYIGAPLGSNFSIILYGFSGSIFKKISQVNFIDHFFSIVKFQDQFQGQISSQFQDHITRANFKLNLRTKFQD